MKDSNCLIRIAQEKDLQMIIDLYHQLLPDDPVINDGSDSLVFNQILEDPKLHIFVLITGGRIVSTCYLNIIPNLTRNASPYGIIENVITDAAMRRRGYGRQIMQFAVDYAWRANCYKVMLQSAVEREPAHRFYEACGFDQREKFAFIAKSPLIKY